MSKKKQPEFRACGIVKRNDKDIYVQIGAAWPTSTGGYVIRLNALPLGDTILLTVPHPNEQVGNENID